MKSKPRVVWYEKWRVWIASWPALALPKDEWTAYITFVRELNRLNGRINE